MDRELLMLQDSPLRNFSSFGAVDAWVDDLSSFGEIGWMDERDWLECAKACLLEFGSSPVFIPMFPHLRRIPCYVSIYKGQESLCALEGGGVASGGLRELIPCIARTAVAVGVDGIFMEVHNDPLNAPVDGPTQWPLRHLEELLEELVAIAVSSPPYPEIAVTILKIMNLAFGDSNKSKSAPNLGIVIYQSVGIRAFRVKLLLLAQRAGYSYFFEMISSLLPDGGLSKSQVLHPNGLSENHRIRGDIFVGSFWSLKGQARGKGRAYTVLSEERRGIFSKLQRDILAFLKSKFEEKEAFRDFQALRLEIWGDWLMENDDDMKRCKNDCSSCKNMGRMKNLAELEDGKKLNGSNKEDQPVKQAGSIIWVPLCQVTCHTWLLRPCVPMIHVAAKWTHTFNHDRVLVQSSLQKVSGHTFRWFCQPWLERLSSWHSWPFSRETFGFVMMPLGGGRVIITLRTADRDRGRRCGYQRSREVTCHHSCPFALQVAEHGPWQAVGMT
ncbi:2-dehydro-3-deoxyphosphooctonate aldolase 2 [Vitis vinifera]|uniref:2-dehydro-3-deoxyphosphooctonate aldolase 2 n=1 Tax=Vitis vinifera TaxID=29760 RepID=A0A438DMX6_VITVI|nr:2-dehydro-3-deoxyphosphooctonate aldolase 2 [Vitis vinifera]